MAGNRFNGNRDLGFGIGLRIPHYKRILADSPALDWFEIISENFITGGGRPREVLESILEHYPVIQHGVSLCFGDTEPFNRVQLKKLKALVEITGTPYLSDHLSWGSHGGIHSHDLLPLPYTKEVAKHTADRIRYVQDFLEIPVCVENVSSYLEYTDSSMTEWQFLSEVVELADCGILLDLNNIHVSAFNHNFDPADYLAGVPLERVAQVHLAGPTDRGDYLLDTHDHPVPDRVWSLYRHLVSSVGSVNTLLEWDNNIPSFEEVREEVLKAREIFEQCTGVSNKPEESMVETEKSVVVIGSGSISGGAPDRLEKVQNFLIDSIKRPLGKDYEMILEPGMAVEEYVLAGEKHSSRDRLEIYCQQYWYRLLDCMEEDFPGILKVLGRDRFSRLSREYLSAYPSGYLPESYLLKDLGKHLAAFVRERPELVEPHDELIYDLARFEYAQVFAFDEEGLPAISLEVLERQDFNRVSFRTQPYMVLLSLSYPLDDFSIALKKGGSSTREAATQREVSSESTGTGEDTAQLPEPEPIKVVVHRHGNRIYFKRLNEFSFEFLGLLSAGNTLAEAVSELIEMHPKLQDDLPSFSSMVKEDCASWVRLGWLCPSGT